MLANEEKLTFSVEEARRLLGISRSLIYDSIAKGDIRTIRLGGRILVPRQVIEELLAGAEPNN